MSTQNYLALSWFGGIVIHMVKNKTEHNMTFIGNPKHYLTIDTISLSCIPSSES